MSSNSPMLSSTCTISPTEKRLALPAGAILRERHNRRKTIYYGCLPANGILAIIILLHTSIIAFWILREYYFFDFKCAMLQYEFSAAIGGDNDERAVETITSDSSASVKLNPRRGRRPRQMRSARGLLSGTMSRRPSTDTEWHLNMLHILRRLQGSAHSATHNRKRRCTALRTYEHSVENGDAQPESVPYQLTAARRTRYEQPGNNSGRFRRHFGKPLNSSKEHRSWVQRKDSERAARLAAAKAHDAAMNVRPYRSKQQAALNQFGRPIRPRLNYVKPIAASPPTQGSPRAASWPRNVTSHRSMSNGSDKAYRTFTRGPLQSGKSTRFHATPRGGNSRVPSKKLGFATRSRAPMNVTRPKPTRRKLHHPSKKPLHSKGNAPVSGDRIRSSSPVSSTKLLNHPKKKPAMKKNTKKKKIMDGSAQRNSSLLNRHQTQKKHKSGESWESNEAKPAKKRYHFLSGPTSNQRPNSTHRTSWLHGVIDPASESFSNKGDIRFYRGRVAKKKPKRLRVPQKPGQPSVGADTYYGEAPERNASPEDASNNRGRGGAQQQARNRTSSERSSELKKKAQRKWKTAEDAVRRPGHRIKSSKEYTKKDSRSREVDKLPPGVRFSPRMKLSNIRTSVEPMSTKSNQPTPASSQLKPTTLNALSTPVQNGSPINADSSMNGDDVLGEQSRKTFHANIYHSASLGPIPRRSTIGPMIGVARANVDGVEVERLSRVVNQKSMVPSTTIETTTEMSEEELQKRRENFIAQLKTFSDSAICIARTLLDLWCVAECLAAIPFLIGILCPMRCLFAAHIILDTLFLVIAFIYSITLAVYSVILYMIVDDMSIWTLLQWIGFATALNLILAIYVVVFIITLRCCELVVDCDRSAKTRRLNHAEHTPYHVHTLDGTTANGNAV